MSKGVGRGDHLYPIGVLGLVSIDLDAARRLCLLLFFVAQWPLLADGAQWFDEITDRRRLFMDGAIF